VASTSKRIQLQITGIVQGVGFRPFIYQLAQKLSLGGSIYNNGNGVVVEIEGEYNALYTFMHQLKRSAPELSRIDTVEQIDIALKNETSFHIIDSLSSDKHTMISPDMALCDACTSELHDPSNRRYNYPFINCTDCGPRYSIIQTVPYDRKNTSMQIFSMCPSCQKEYEDPTNRRYHAQPISCYECGPTLFLRDINGDIIAEERDAMNKACQLIKSGKCVAIKGIGGFHLVCDATNEEAVTALRVSKHRPTKPLAVMFDSLEAIDRETLLTPQDKMVVLQKDRPINLVRKIDEISLAPSIAPHTDKLGVFLPYTPLHILLLEKLGHPIVATSANISDEPIITDAQELVSKLNKVFYAILDHDRPIVNACDDSVVFSTDNQLLTMRMARGYAPKSFPLKDKVMKKTLAVGANQKNSIALAFEKHLLLSPHIGDLVSIEATEYFKRTIETYKRFYDFEPEVIVCDKHPSYETHVWASAMHRENPKIELIKVQHHYAHALACMAEYKLTEKVLAFCFDGTGYGDDGTLWGGEVLIADTLNYSRKYHLDSFRLLGGEKAVREPRRIAMALLFECYTLEDILSMDNPTTQSFSKAEVKTMHKMWERGINAPYSTSIGRLFDGIASLSGIAQKIDYEGESGVMMESQALLTSNLLPYPFEIDDEVIQYKSIVEAILDEDDLSVIAGRFMLTLVEIILCLSKRHKELPVVLSGGVFQNRYLVEATLKRLRAEKIRYYIQEETPINDGSISLGQLYHAYHLQRKQSGT